MRHSILLVGCYISRKRCRKYNVIEVLDPHHSQWLKWFCEAGGGAHLTKPGWSKPHSHSNPTNLALFRHKITLYRFNQGGSYYCRGAQMGAAG